MAKIRIEYEFDYYEDGHEVTQIMRASEYYSVLYDIDQELRSKMKHGEDSWLEIEEVYDYLSKIRDMIHDSGVLRDDY